MSFYVQALRIKMFFKALFGPDSYSLVNLVEESIQLLEDHADALDDRANDCRDMAAAHVSKAQLLNSKATNIDNEVQAVEDLIAELRAALPVIE